VQIVPTLLSLGLAVTAPNETTVAPTVAPTVVAPVDAAAQLRATMQGILADLSTLMQQIDAIVEEMKGLQAETPKRSHFPDDDDGLAMFEKALAKWKAKVAKTEQELEAANAKLAELKSELDDTQSELERLQRELSNVKGEQRKDLERHLQAARRDVRRAHAKRVKVRRKWERAFGRLLEIAPATPETRVRDSRSG
jgi:chromosome segregation ATPase